MRWPGLWRQICWWVRVGVGLLLVIACGCGEPVGPEVNAEGVVLRSMAELAADARADDAFEFDLVVLDPGQGRKLWRNGYRGWFVAGAAPVVDNADRDALLAAMGSVTAPPPHADGTPASDEEKLRYRGTVKSAVADGPDVPAFAPQYGIRFRHMGYVSDLLYCFPRGEIRDFLDANYRGSEAMTGDRAAAEAVFRRMAQRYRIVVPGSGSNTPSDWEKTGAGRPYLAPPSVVAQGGYWLNGKLHLPMPKE